MRIPEDELGFEFSRSGGPGGQNVNKVETKVTLLFDVERSPSLGDDDRRRIRARLGSRINKEGILRVSSQRMRTREANRRAVLARFEELIARALTPRRARVKTAPTAGARRRRVEQKRRRGEVKRRRSDPPRED
jgi:ribosome-associated protein